MLSMLHAFDGGLARRPHIYTDADGFAHGNFPRLLPGVFSAYGRKRHFYARGAVSALLSVPGPSRVKRLSRAAIARNISFTRCQDDLRMPTAHGHEHRSGFSAMSTPRHAVAEGDAGHAVLTPRIGSRMPRIIACIRRTARRYAG